MRVYHIHTSQHLSLYSDTPPSPHPLPSPCHLSAPKPLTHLLYRYNLMYTHISIVVEVGAGGGTIRFVVMFFLLDRWFGTISLLFFQFPGILEGFGSSWRNVLLIWTYSGTFSTSWCRVVAKRHPGRTSFSQYLCANNDEQTASS